MTKLSPDKLSMKYDLYATLTINHCYAKPFFLSTKLNIFIYLLLFSFKRALINSNKDVIFFIINELIQIINTLDFFSLKLFKTHKYYFFSKKNLKIFESKNYLSSVKIWNK